MKLKQYRFDNEFAVYGHVLNWRKRDTINARVRVSSYLPLREIYPGNSFLGEGWLRRSRRNGNIV